jgi:hypothetical protein
VVQEASESQEADSSYFDTKRRIFDTKIKNMAS